MACESSDGCRRGSVGRRGEGAATGAARSSVALSLRRGAGAVCSTICSSTDGLILTAEPLDVVGVGEGAGGGMRLPEASSCWGLIAVDAPAVVEDESCGNSTGKLRASTERRGLPAADISCGREIETDG